MGKESEGGQFGEKTKALTITVFVKTGAKWQLAITCHLTNDSSLLNGRAIALTHHMTQ